MTEIRIPVPRLPAGLLSNLVGLLGLIAVAVSVGGLTGNWWWSLLTGGVMAVGLAYMAGATSGEAAETGESAAPVRPHPAATETARPRLAAAAAARSA